MDPIATIAAFASQALISALWAAYRRPIVLGIAIVGFSITGLGMIIGSHAVTGWWQAALLGFGISLLVVGTVELGLLGVIKKLVESNGEGSEVLRVLPTKTAATLPEIAATLHELANRLERGTLYDPRVILAALETPKSGRTEGSAAAPPD